MSSAKWSKPVALLGWATGMVFWWANGGLVMLGACAATLAITYYAASYSGWRAADLSIRLGVTMAWILPAWVTGTWAITALLGTDRWIYVVAVPLQLWLMWILTNLVRGRGPGGGWGRGGAGPQSPQPSDPSEQQPVAA